MNVYIRYEQYKARCEDQGIVPQERAEWIEETLEDQFEDDRQEQND